MDRRHGITRYLGFLAILQALISHACGQETQLPRVHGVDAQPLALHARQIIEALDYTGTPLNEADRKALEEALERRSCRQES